ncbi:putative membrane protein [Algoriphagus sp. 4150]|uniref:EamA family transporter n=1 Tax=Algoriphagus sp. 4150 TaxID=2817756 RepID=UPI0028647A11|nr:EamA family transporter [Algoriphagus sp. 4150]MDR7127860.1 putative membrane protein [Algoriphagus sp. 4150]
MLGFILAFGTAISEALKDIFSKVNLRYVDEYTVALSMHLVISVLLTPIVLVMGVEEMSVRFFVALISSSFLQLAVILLYMKAIKRAELSVTVPLITLTPLFMLLSSPILIGQFPNLPGIGGILFIVAGTYLLNMEGSKREIFAPFKNLVYNQSSRYMLIVAFLWSITANIDKIGVEETSPVFWAFSKDLLILLYLIPIVFIKSKAPLEQLKSRWLQLLGIGIFRTTSVLTQMFAIQFILVAYVISIKRSSALLIILYSFFFLHERKNFKTRLLAIVIISVGLALIALS